MIRGGRYRIPYLCNHREYQKFSISKVNYKITNNLFSEKERFFIAILNPFFVFYVLTEKRTFENTTELLFYPINLTILCIK